MSAATGASLDATTEEAIDWLVLMRSGEATAQDRRELDGWLLRSLAHRRAWQSLIGSVDAAFSSVREINERHPGQASILAATIIGSAARSARRRRMLRGALAVGGVGFLAGLVAERQTPLEDLLADWRTGTGERRAFQLADGSSLLLNARSAADGAITPARRGISLRHGEAIVETAAQARPFLLTGVHGSLLAGAHVGARFLLRQQNERSLAVALENAIELAPSDGPRRVLQAGEGTWFGPGGLVPAPEVAPTAALWQHGQLEVHNQSLGEVIAALRPYRRGFLRISPEAARLRVYGSYPLDDTDRALQVIAETLPVAVRTHPGGWLVRIDVA